MVVLGHEISSYARGYRNYSLEFGLDVFITSMLTRIKQRRWAYKAQRLIYVRSSFYLFNLQSYDYYLQ